jgi:hypothetical protein
LKESVFHRVRERHSLIKGRAAGVSQLHRRFIRATTRRPQKKEMAAQKSPNGLLGCCAAYAVGQQIKQRYGFS